MFLQIKKNLRNFLLRKIINGNERVNCYDADDVITSYLQNPQDDFSSLSPLYVPTE